MINITKKALKELYGIRDCSWETDRPKKYHKAILGYPNGTNVLITNKYRASHISHYFWDVFPYIRHAQKIYQDNLTSYKTKGVIIDKFHNPFCVTEIGYLIQVGKFYCIILGCDAIKALE